MVIAPYYRVYELPWSPTEDAERRFHKVLRNAFIVFGILALIIVLMPMPERKWSAAPDLPDRVVKLVIEKPLPPPPPPPKVEEKKPEPLRVEEPRPRPRPTPEPPRPDARERAQQSGLLKLQDQLAALRDNAAIEKAASAKDLTGRVDEQSRSERALVTSKVGAGSGGINTAALSRGYGSGAGALGEHATAQVNSALAEGLATPNNVQRGGSGKASRSEEEIALVFDRNKGAIYSIYTRALRDQPNLQGKLVLELTIAPDGSVTRCEVVSSELNDAELERKLVARVKLFRFEAKDVGTITVTKPIDFFPA
jgi:protein TonB